MKMPKVIRISVLHDSEYRPLVGAKWCESFLCRLKGFTFRKRLDLDESILLVFDRETVFGTSIHMLMVFTKLAIFWINDDGIIVDKKIAQPFSPYIAAKAPARYVLETHVHLYDSIEIGSEIRFEQVDTN